MNNINRAKQFAAFDALKGYYDMIDEAQIISKPKRELSEYKISVINRRLINLEKGDRVAVIYYSKTRYRTIQGTVMSIDTVYKTITVDNVKIHFDDIYELKS